MGREEPVGGPATTVSNAAALAAIPIFNYRCEVDVRQKPACRPIFPNRADVGIGYWEQWCRTNTSTSHPTARVSLTNRFGGCIERPTLSRAIPARHGYSLRRR